MGKGGEGAATLRPSFLSEMLSEGILTSFLTARPCCLAPPSITRLPARPCAEPEP